MRTRALSPVISCALLICGIMTPRLAAGTHAAPAHSDARSVVRTFMADLHTAFQTGDFSAVAALYAPKATLTWSFHTGKSGTLHGVANIVAFYKGDVSPGKFLWLDSVTLLSPTVAYAYEHFGSAGQKSPSLCTHVYVVTGGKIATEEFVEFYPGTGM
jgi:ketosteroid isomerase-like protein